MVEPNFSVKYLKSLSDKFLTSFSRLEFINCILQMKTNIFFKTPTNCFSKFSSHVTMISTFFIVIINEFSAYPTRVTWVKLFLFFTHDQTFVEILFHYFYTILILFKNCFNKFISSIFTSKNNYWLGRFIINTNKFVSKTTRNVILILFWARTFITFNRF